MNAIAIRTDKVGIVASMLCMVHCLATPFLFLAKSYSISCSVASPAWWSSLDIIFLIISFLAVYQSGKNTSKSWIKYALWTAWVLLLIILSNEKLHLLHLWEHTIHFPAVALIALHFYNSKFCKCNTDNCCINQTSNHKIDEK